MSTTRSFSNMLNEYLANELLIEEFKKRSWIIQNVEMDNSWKTGNYIVPFVGAIASSVSFGQLTASNDIAEEVTVRGTISTVPEAWLSLNFNHRDIMEHDKISEQNFLKLLPDQIDRAMDYFKNVVGLAMLNGSAFARATVDGDASGNLTVDRPERFELNQKCQVDDDDSSPVDGYVKTINLQTSVINFVTARSGATPVNLSGYTVAQNAKVYFDQSQSNGFTSLKSSLLSNANGGTATLYGQTKTSYPFLQAINVDGSALTPTSMLQGIFDAFTTIRQRGKGAPTKVLMSYRNLGFVMTTLESAKGAYHIDQKASSVETYNWVEIDIIGVKGKLTVVGLEEIDDDYIVFLDPRAVVIPSNGGFKKRIAPDGKEYFETRATTGYSYIVDTCFFGDLVLKRPSYCGILYNIPVTFS